MKVFTQNNVYNEKFPKTSEIKKRYKEPEGGVRSMSELMEKLKLEWLNEGREEGMKKGIEKVAGDMKSKGFDIDTIIELTGLTRDKILAL